MTLNTIPIMNVKSILVTLTLCLSFVTGAFVSGATTPALVVHMANGDDHTFLFSETPTITYLEDNCIITTKNLNLSFKLSDISFAEILDDATSVDVVTVDTPTIDLSNPDVAHITGLKPLSAVILYDLKGMEMNNVAADLDGCAIVNLSALSTGTYIIFTNQTSFKIYKK